MLGCVPRYAIPTPTPDPARSRFLVRSKLRLVVLDFSSVEGTGELDRLARSIPAVLLTELMRNGRFEVVDGGNLRQTAKHEAITEQTAKQVAEFYLTGTVISENPSCVDVRVANAYNHSVIYSNDTCLGQKTIARDKLMRLAADIGSSIRQIENVRVTGVDQVHDNQIVLMDRGAKHGVQVGMVGYILGEADTVPTVSLSTIPINEQVLTFADAGEDVPASPIVVGTLYVINVEKESCTGVLTGGDYALAGDVVHFY